MRTAALFLALLWALGCALAYPCPKSLRMYLGAALAVNLGTEASLYAFGETARAYAIAYALFTAIGLLAAINILGDALTRRWHAAVGILAAVFVVARAYAGLPKPLHFYDWFALVEGFVLAFAGAALVFSAAYQPMRSIYLALSALWLMQCVFRLGFVLSLPSPTWLKLNEVLPTVLVCGCYGWIGLKLLEQKAVTLQ